MKTINSEEYRLAFDLMIAGLTTQIIASEIMDKGMEAKRSV